MKRYDRPHSIATNGLRSYRAAMKLIGNNQIQEIERWLNNRCKNSHLPFRRREYAMVHFKHMRSLQKFVSIHSSIYNHLNIERHLNSRETYKDERKAALVEWQQIYTASYQDIIAILKRVSIRLTASRRRFRVCRVSLAELKQ
jgi:putative transposase|tara:strand:- start:179 stop:607 length:429 start_codon:yes stop_codon:yes gene_type:complete